MTTPVSILLADDHQMILDGIRSMLASEERYIVTATAANGQQAWEIIQHDPSAVHLLITDISMSHLTGIELCRKVKAIHPSVKVLILSMYSAATVVKEALAAEADGFLLKSAGKDEFLSAIHRVMDSGTYFAQDILPIIYGQMEDDRKQKDNLDMLSAREREVLALIMKEHTSEEIGAKLFISKRTVDVHRQNILAKTGCRTTVGLVKFALRNGLQ
jgi:DNA-binding NarL/FixJ family response regulator